MSLRLIIDHSFHLLVKNVVSLSNYYYNIFTIYDEKKIIALIAMERPRTLSAEAIRDEKVRVLKHIKPIDPKNLVDLQKAVKKHGADIGLAFDGDADRCFLVDETGDLVNPSALTALIADRALASNPGSTIIYNLISLTLLFAPINSLKLKLWNLTPYDYTYILEFPNNFNKKCSLVLILMG